jgi:hypothetical protein
LKKEILSDGFKKRKIFWKNIAENFLENFPYGKNGKFFTSHHYIQYGRLETESLGNYLGIEVSNSE